MFSKFPTHHDLIFVNEGIQKWYPKICGKKQRPDLSIRSFPYQKCDVHGVCMQIVYQIRLPDLCTIITLTN